MRRTLRARIAGSPGSPAERHDARGRPRAAHIVQRGAPAASRRASVLQVLVSHRGLEPDRSRTRSSLTPVDRPSSPS